MSVITCPGCRRELQVRENVDLAECPQCGQRINVLKRFATDKVTPQSKATGTHEEEPEERDSEQWRPRRRSPDEQPWLTKKPGGRIINAMRVAGWAIVLLLLLISLVSQMVAHGGNKDLYGIVFLFILAMSADNFLRSLRDLNG